MDGKIMTFKELLNLVSLDNAPRVCIDSRLVKAGDIFVAIKGTVCDGHDFIDQAIGKGAKYIVYQYDGRWMMDDGRETNYELIAVDDSAEAAAILAQGWAGNPASKLTNLAITGTNGKTTVAYLVRSIIQKAGQKCGLIGTIIYDTGSKISQSKLTTPDCLDIAEAQSQMVQAGAKYMVIEASSHALSQNRLAAIEFKAAAFTNLSGDHLDYHKTKEEYLAAKTKLFTALSPDAITVLNKQSPEAKQIAEKTKAKILWYAVDEPANISAHIESMDINGTRFSILDTRYSSSIEVKTPLLGMHNVSNHLAAAGLCLAAGFDLETIAKGLSALQTIPGRLEKVDYSKVRGRWSDERRGTRDEGRETSHVFVDYAHTDDALKNVLTTLKPLCKGKLILVFGCGGDRDRTKRPRMAKVAEQLADLVVVTSDNPRTERPEDIINEIVAGFENKTVIRTMEEGRWKRDEGRAAKVIEPDRRKAIELAIKSAKEDDIVLIAGKGHENYQIIGAKKIDFSDKKIAKEYLCSRLQSIT